MTVKALQLATVLVASAVLNVLVLAFFLLRPSTPADDFAAVRDNPVWSPLLNDDRTIFVVVGDFNRDRKADLVAPTVDHVAPYRSGVVVLLGDGHGFTPAPGSPFAAGPGAYNVAVGDVNEDGKVDIAASSFEGDGVTILLGR